ncbi:MAG: RNA polymerase sigma factor [Phycisphaerae bacterium]
MSDGVTNHEVPDPDAESVRLARQGDYEAFERLVARHERSIYTLAMRIVRNPEDAEDVVQQTFLSVLEHLNGFAGQSQFRTWLVRIATNHALKTLRKRRGLPIAATGAAGEDDDTWLPHPEFIAPWRDDPGELAGRRETQQLLDAALDQLDEKYRLVFLLRDVEGLSTEETARELGITVANVKVRLLRARLMLREKLTRTLGDTQRRVIARHDHGE